MFPFTSTALAGIIDKRRPVRTPILDRHFSTTRQLGVSLVQFDVVNGPEGLAVAISAGARSRRAKSVGYDTLTVNIPRFSEHDMVKAADLKNLRRPGAQFGGPALVQHVNEKLDAIRARFDRTKEYMAIGALKGEVIDAAGNVIAQFDTGSQQTVTFKPDGSGDNPFKLFDAAELAFSRVVGGDPGTITCYCGADAYAALRDEGEVQASSKSRNPQVVMENGKLRSVAGIQVERLGAVFVDELGVERPFLEDDEMMLVAEYAGGVRLLAPCEAPQGLLQQEWFVDRWEERDPAGTKLRVETNPLPLLQRPEAVRRYKVKSA